VPAGEPDLAARCLAVLDSSADRSVVCFTTAARAQQLWLPEVPDELHVATAWAGRYGRDMTRTRRTEIIAHRLQLGEQDIVLKDGLWLTSLARTWRDLAGLLSLPDLVAAGDSALRSGATLAQFNDVMARTAGGRGARRARAALGLLDARSRSRPESHMRVAVRLAGIEDLLVNQAVYRDEGGWLAEPDLAVPEAKLALEYQGKDHAEVKRMRKDLTRAADLRGEQWLVLPYGPAEVFGRPWTVGAEAFAAVQARAPHLIASWARHRRSRSRVVTY